jgi:hypothetical protein
MNPIDMRFVNVWTAIDLLKLEIDAFDPHGYLGQVLRSRMDELENTIRDLKTTVEQEREMA